MDDGVLANKLAGLTDTALRSAIWQVRYWIPFELFGECAIVGALVVGIWLVRKHWDDLDDVGQPLSVIGLIILAIFSVVVLVIGVPNTLSAIWNPEFWAIRALLGKS